MAKETMIYTGESSKSPKSKFDLLQEEMSKLFKTKKQGIVDISCINIEKARDERLTVMGRMYGGKLLHLDDIIDELHRVWQTRSVVQIELVNREHVKIRFKDENEYHHALENGPWIINGFVFSIKKWKWVENLEEYHFDLVEFWVHIWDLPKERINKANVWKIGAELGRVKAEDLSCPMEFKDLIARIRVELDIKERLTKDHKIRLETGQVLSVRFKYEKLGIFCYFCGVIGHDHYACSIREKYRNDLIKCGGSPKDIKPNFTFALKANRFYNSVANTESERRKAQGKSPESKGRTDIWQIGTTLKVRGTQVAKNGPGTAEATTGSHSNDMILPDLKNRVVTCGILGPNPGSISGLEPVLVSQAQKRCSNPCPSTITTPSYPEWNPYSQSTNTFYLLSFAPFPSLAVQSNQSSKPDIPLDSQDVNPNHAPTPNPIPVRKAEHTRVKNAPVKGILNHNKDGWNKYFLEFLFPKPIVDIIGNIMVRPSNEEDCQIWRCHPKASTGGILLSETLDLVSRKVPNFAVGCSLFASHSPAGIAGFGRGSASLPSQLGLSKFSYCLLSHRFDDSTQSSSLVLDGELNNGDSKTNGVSYTPFVKNPVTGRPAFSVYYYVGLRKITVGDKTVKIPYSKLSQRADGNGGAIVDSGSTFTFMEGHVFEPVAAELEKQTAHYKRLTDVENVTGLRPCYDISGGKPVSFPKLVFHFKGGADMELPVTNYFSLVGDGIACMTIITDGVVGGGGGLSGGPAVILGNFQMQNFYVEYDLENKRFGFRQQTCK
ncbi:hypothetical protein IFM89_031507 [Coptis chinensis]|uniref:Peptidase A1 domain-containing protein n=1 Tax=Coptis chinensis TaxID=261450 RepID=A0A835LPH4_9MAGN|nr:hypothetical protein IFM89_031507 [Coptis chinensis]